MKFLFFILFFFPISAFDVFKEYSAFKSYKEDDFWKSQQTLESRLLNDPHNSEILYNTANVFYKKNEFDKAKNYYQKALSLEKDNKKSEDIAFNLACSFAQLNDLPQALIEFENVLKINDKNIRAKENIEKIKKLLEQQKNQQEKSKKDQEDKEKKEEKERNDSKSDQKKSQDQKDKQEKNKEEEKNNEKEEQEDESKQQQNQKQKKDKDQDEKKADNEKKSNDRETDKNDGSSLKHENQKAENDQSNEQQGQEFDNNLDAKTKAILKVFEDRDKKLNKQLVKMKLQQEKIENQNGQNNW